MTQALAEMELGGKYNKRGVCLLSTQVKKMLVFTVGNFTDSEILWDGEKRQDGGDILMIRIYLHKADRDR